MIRQAISCDICGAEKKQTNHWFVAYEQGGELRVSGWNSRNRLRPGSKHLCGQTCLHKLVDDFMARTLRARAPQAATSDAEDVVAKRAAKTDTSLTKTDTSLTTCETGDEFESSARLISVPAPARPPLRIPMELVAAPDSASENAVAVNEPPRYASRNWRAAAWEREREREMRAANRRPDLASRRYSS